MRTCPDCHALVADTANFCDNCGYPLGQAAGAGLPPAAPEPVPPVSASNLPPDANVAPGTCSACGFVNLPGETFCQNCGVQLHPVASQPPPLPRQVSGPVPPVPPEQGLSREAPPVAPASSGIHGHFLIYPNQQTLPLPQGETEITLGRSDPVKGVYPHVDLTPYGGDSSGVSRRHARLTYQNGVLYIEDLNSTNFTFLNRRKLVPGQRYPLENGDELRLGLLMLEYFA
jgi:hypothetical protein